MESTDAWNYKMGPVLADCFKTSEIKSIIQEVMNEKLQGKIYVADEARRLVQDISDTIIANIHENVNMMRYKYVAQVFLGQQTGAGLNYSGMCCWDANADSQVSDVFSSPNMFCVCTVFGSYLY
ncbi:dynein light chain Tctex-type protein 2B-like [Teleopsis dalmanni]|uniref:dynein light chain Tctex-type protein 2B-like n=1 Tax=Teleopsis dalmanni TaxID=139649 RepID=UPI0018CCFA62|nr:dynein light chain Tctex-type protein 2B-like [Teleopsis dalmanni]